MTQYLQHVEFLAVLTRRELDVLRLLIHGLPTKEIAGRLGLSGGTIRNHLASLNRKLGARNPTEAALKAARLLGLSAPASHLC